MKKVLTVGIIALLLISFVVPVRLFGSSSEEETKLVTLGTGDNSTTTYGNGWKEVRYADGRVAHTDGMRTYLRWDGVWRPFSEWSTAYTNISGDLIADGGNFKSIFDQHKNRIVTDKFSFSQQPSKVYFLNTENKSQYYSILNHSAASSITIENNKLIYENIYPNVDYEFTYSGTKLKEDIVSHRTSYPNSAYGNSNTYLVFSTKLWEFSGIHKLIDDDGEIIGNKDVKGILKLKNVNEDVLSYLPIGDASSVFVNQTCYNETNGEPYICNQTKTTKVHNRVIKVSGTWYLFSGINYSWVKDINRIGDITIDPTWVVGSGGNAWSGNATFDDTVEVQSTGDVELRQEVDDYVSYWRFDKGIGNTAYDENETSNNDGSFTAGSTGNWTSPSKYGNYALEFDGTDDYVDCGNDASLNITDAITIEAWVKPDVLDVALPIGGKEAGWHFTRYSTNAIAFSFRDGAGAWQITLSTSTINLNWHHVVITREGAINKIYIDSVLDKTQTLGTSGLYSLPTNQVDIGKSYADNWYGTAYFNGTIDEVRIYNRALSNDEINQTMDNEHHTTGNLTSWHDAGSGNEIYKLSVNFTFPANTNASINLYNNNTGAFIETLATNNNTEQWSKTITGAVQDSKVNITLYGNVSQTPEVHNITYHTQVAAGGTTPSISNIINGSINSTAHWVDWDVNQTAHNRWNYSLYSNMSGSSWSSWQNSTAAPNITVTGLTASTTYYYQVQSCNTTDVSLCTNSTVASFTTSAVDTTFTVTLPTGYMYAIFNLTGVSGASTQTNYEPEGQSALQEFYNVTNTGNVNLDVYLKLQPEQNQSAYWSMDEGVGTYVNDTSDNDNNGTWYGNTTANWTTDTPFGTGYALEFDGTDDYVDCGNDASLNITDAITIEAWVKWNDEDYSYILNSLTDTTDLSTSKINLVVAGTGNVIGAAVGEVYMYNGSETTLLNFVISENAWTHLVLSRVGTGADQTYVYKNGVLLWTGTWTNTATNPYVLIGIMDTLLHNCFNGTIDEVRIYNRALSNDEIYAHYKNWFNQTPYNTILKADTDNNSTGATEINTTLQTLYSGLTPNSYLDLWLWSDFDHTPQQAMNKTLSINVTQS